MGFKSPPSAVIGHWPVGTQQGGDSVGKEPASSNSSGVHPRACSTDAQELCGPPAAPSCSSSGRLWGCCKPSMSLGDGPPARAQCLLLRESPGLWRRGGTPESPPSSFSELFSLRTSSGADRAWGPGRPRQSGGARAWDAQLSARGVASLDVH